MKQNTIRPMLFKYWVVCLLLFILFIQARASSRTSDDKTGRSAGVAPGECGNLLDQRRVMLSKQKKTTEPTPVSYTHLRPFLAQRMLVFLERIDTTEIFKYRKRSVWRCRECIAKENSIFRRCKLGADGGLRFHRRMCMQKDGRSRPFFLLTFFRRGEPLRCKHPQTGALAFDTLRGFPQWALLRLLPS